MTYMWVRAAHCWRIISHGCDAAQLQCCGYLSDWRMQKISGGLEEYTERHDKLTLHPSHTSTCALQSHSGQTCTALLICEPTTNSHCMAFVIIKRGGPDHTGHTSPKTKNQRQTHTASGWSGHIHCGSAQVEFGMQGGECMSVRSTEDTLSWTRFCSNAASVSL